MRVDGDAKLLTGELIDKNITDANGDVCAGLIIKSNLSGLSYDSNNGIVKINRKPGEDLLFLSPNERIVSVFKMDYLPLKIDLNSYGIRLKSGEVWEITITDKANDNLLSVNIIISPDDARLLIDKKKAEVTRVHYLENGIHTIVIQRNGYKVVVDTINVSDNNTLFVYELSRMDNTIPVIKEYVVNDRKSYDFKPQMVFIKGGAFNMGSALGEKNELPIHEIFLNDFYISNYEITFAQYDQFCEATGRKKPDDNNWGRGHRPVINVSWHDAGAYCKWLSKETGKRFKLPTEAEWEYAAMGGSRSAQYTYSGSNNIDEVAWYYNNSNNRTHEVGTKGANELGIYDMSGNVWEWCNDWYSSSYYSSSLSNDPRGPSSGSRRVARGGSWGYNAYDCRSANRGNNSPRSTDNNVGFRIAWTP